MYTYSSDELNHHLVLSSPLLWYGLYDFFLALRHYFLQGLKLKCPFRGVSLAATFGALTWGIWTLCGGERNSNTCQKEKEAQENLLRGFITSFRLLSSPCDVGSKATDIHIR